MKHEKLCDALSHVRDSYIQEASAPKKRFPWLGAVAAVLILGILLSGILSPAAPAQDPLLQSTLPAFTQPPQTTEPTQTEAPASFDSHLMLLAAGPDYPKLAPYPLDHNGDAHTAWWEDQRAIHNQPEGYGDNLKSYFGSLISQVLKGHGGENAACSPVNIYLALAMLTETAGGESRQQLLDLLQASDIEALREQAKNVWEGHYNDDGVTTSILANSLWLEEGYPCNEDTVSTLAESYYASVFRGDLGSEEVDIALRDWLNEQTQGLLQEQAGKLSLSDLSVMALASTVFYRVQWQNKFFPEKNTTEVFHSTTADVQTEFMNRQISYNPYFWGEHFGAVFLDLEDGGRMWLILPDEGYTPEMILEEAATFLASNPTSLNDPWADQKSVIINLSVPKFDISSYMELSQVIENLGVTDIFQPGVADFSPLFPEDDDGFIDQIKHAARVAIDEDGVTAAAFTVIDRCGAGMPPTDEMDFVLDRPFLFYIESQDGLPMFTGIVNQP